MADLLRITFSVLLMSFTISIFWSLVSGFKNAYHYDNSSDEYQNNLDRIYIDWDEVAGSVIDCIYWWIGSALVVFGFLVVLGIGLVGLGLFIKAVS